MYFKEPKTPEIEDLIRWSLAISLERVCAINKKNVLFCLASFAPVVCIYPPDIGRAFLAGILPLVTTLPPSFGKSFLFCKIFFVGWF